MRRVEERKRAKGTEKRRDPSCIVTEKGQVGAGSGEEIEARGLGRGGRDRVNNNRRRKVGVSSDPV